MTSVRETVAAVVGGRLGYEDGLDLLTVAPAAEVDPVLAGALFEAAARLFRAGWSPAEVHRVVARRGDPAHGHLVVDAVAAYLRGFKPRAVDPRWKAQADGLGARAWWGADEGYVRQVAQHRRADRVSLIDAVLGVLTVLATLPPLEVLIPPPGQVARPGGHANANGPMLDRVRALLAKAESTTFPAEAEAYSAKAQELISRHSLDEALVGAGDAAVTPYARRVGIDHPYESEKAALLDAVARANRCHVVWSPEFGFATVFGFDADIDAVELLHTSLLVQAHRAMARDEPRGKAGRARLKTFRQSFLIGYAVRIGERLAEADRAALAGTGDAAALLPVLKSRDVQVREARDRAFPRTVRGRGFRVDSEEGWESGREAADRASLGSRTV